MENNIENLVTEEAVAENTEQTVEETPKTYTEAEFNAKLDEVLGKKLARREAKIRKEYEPLVNTLRAGTGKESIGELNDAFSKFYESKGIKINKQPEYSAKDIEVLARAEADEIIRGGFDEVVEEVDRLTELGYERMTAKDKAVFKTLAEYRQNAERSNELSKIGVTDEVYNSPEFQDFARKFNKNTPISDIWNIYNQTKPKKEFKTMGNVKNSASAEVKEFYSQADIEKLTMKDLDDPKVWEAVRRSMTGR